MQLGSLTLTIPPTASGSPCTSDNVIKPNRKRIVQTRLRFDPRNRDSYERRTKEGKTRREIVRCLKRYAAREVFHLVRPTQS